MASRHASAWDSPGFLLWHAGLRWQREMRQALEPHGLTHVQFVLLASAWWLETHRERPTQAELAAHCATDAMMTSQVLRALEAAGLVSRTTDPGDARARRVGVTPDGVTRVTAALGAVEDADDAFFADVADEPFVAGLGRLARPVTPPGEAPPPRG